MQAAVTGGLEGQLIAGKYQLLRLLGQGGMGAVYEGRNATTFKRCAVKVLLSPALAMNAELVKRFFREARAGSAIDSDHIVEIYDSGTDPENGCPYMVMEYLQGEDLEGTMRRVQGPLDPTAASKMVLQASIGLGRAHDAGIIHRDIKPANLFLTQRDSGELLVKILDFGIAKVKMENFQETSTGLTRTGSMLGTPLYMSPEQCKAAGSIDARSDVWSLGVVLWELLTGGSPFTHATSLGALMASIITEELPLVQDRAPWLAPELAEVVHRAMSRDITKRFQSAAELRDALATIVPGGPRLTPDQIVPVHQDHRDYIAPRLVVTDDGMLRATARTGISVTRSGADEPKKRGVAPIALGGLALALAVGGVTAWQLKKQTEVAAVAEPSAAIAPSTVVTVIKDASPVVRRLPLVVEPVGVEVEVDAVPVTIVAGTLMLEGAVGATRRITLKLKEQREEHVVAFAESGLVPERIVLAAPAPPAPSVAPAPPPVRAGKGRASAVPVVATQASNPAPAPVPSPAKPAAQKKSSGLDDAVGEFR
jgi:eukaryotic-like serine/threonine-protein kinase